MPVYGLRRLARSWWAAVAAGLVFSALLAWHVMAVPPVYSAQVNALLLLPTSSVVPNTLATSSESVVDTAGVLQRMVGGQGSGAKPVSDSVTLSAQGIRHGFSVRLPNSGGQWADLYSDPFLDVQAVGSSEAEVQGEMQRVLVALEQGLRRMQDDEAVAPENRIVMQLNPGQPVIRAASGSRIRALGSAGVLGLAAAAGLALLIGQPRARSRERLAVAERPWVEIPATPFEPPALSARVNHLEPRHATADPLPLDQDEPQPRRTRRPAALVGAVVALFVLLAGVNGALAWRGHSRSTAEQGVAAGPRPTASSSAPVITPVTPPTKRLPALLAARNGTLSAMWLGDGLATGRGASTSAHGFRPLMRERLRGDGPLKEVSAVSDGTLAGVRRLPTGLALAVVELGSQDVPDTPVADFRAKYAELLIGVRTVSPGAVLVCAGVWEPTGIASRYDDAVRTACTAVGGTFIALSDIYDRRDTHAADPLLPNDTGHAAIAARMLNTLGV